VQVFTLLLLPDTKHVPLEVVNKRWATHWLWKRVYNKHQNQHEDSLAAVEAGPPAAAAATGASGGYSLQESSSELQLAAVDAAAGSAVPQRTDHSN
jgi:hypothetical protein